MTHKFTQEEKDNILKKNKCCETHCCTTCGCKYILDDCPVVLGIVKPKYECEYCAESSEIDTYASKPLFDIVKCYEFLALRCSTIEIAHIDGSHEILYHDGANGAGLKALTRAILSSMARENRIPE